MSLEPLRRIEAQDPEYPRYRQRQLTTWLVWVGLTGAALLAGGAIAIVVAPVAMAWVIVNVVLDIYHRQQIENFQHYRQLEALTSLHALIDLRYPLPPMRLWGISPDFANLLVTVIKQHRPARILELGSGTSTVIASYALDAAGIEGHITSLEHVDEFTQDNQRTLALHGFVEFAHIVHAPLASVTLEDKQYPWYDTSALDSIHGIDLLIVDGPPDRESKGYRFPALPLLYDKLNDGAIILVDDYIRTAEYQMVNAWLEAYNLEVLDRFANEKGAVILRKVGEAAQRTGEPVIAEATPDEDA